MTLDGFQFAITMFVVFMLVVTAAVVSPIFVWFFGALFGFLGAF